MKSITRVPRGSLERCVVTHQCGSAAWTHFKFCVTVNRTWIFSDHSGHLWWVGVTIREIAVWKALGKRTRDGLLQKKRGAGRRRGGAERRRGGVGRRKGRGVEEKGKTGAENEDRGGGSGR